MKIEKYFGIQYNNIIFHLALYIQVSESIKYIASELFSFVYPLFIKLNSLLFLFIFILIPYSIMESVTIEIEKLSP
jgi:hypothetical protein